MTDQRAHISWWVFPAYGRRGIVTRAARLVTDYAFERLGEQHIEAFIEAENLVSCGVARNAGFKEAGVSQAQGTSHGMLRQVPTAMEARRRPRQKCASLICAPLQLYAVARLAISFALGGWAFQATQAIWPNHSGRGSRCGD